MSEKSSEQLSEQFTVVTIYIPPGKKLQQAVIHTWGTYDSYRKAYGKRATHMRRQIKDWGEPPAGGTLVVKVARIHDEYYGWS
jgi:hypothetical protein